MRSAPTAAWPRPAPETRNTQQSWGTTLAGFHLTTLRQEQQRRRRRQQQQRRSPPMYSFFMSGSQGGQGSRRTFGCLSAARTNTAPHCAATHPQGWRAARLAARLAAGSLALRATVPLLNLAGRKGSEPEVAAEAAPAAAIVICFREGVARAGLGVGPLAALEPSPGMPSWHCRHWRHWRPPRLWAKTRTLRPVSIPRPAARCGVPQASQSAEPRRSPGRGVESSDWGDGTALGRHAHRGHHWQKARNCGAKILKYCKINQNITKILTRQLFLK